MRTARAILLAAVLAATPALGLDASPPPEPPMDAAYAPPATEPGEDGWQDYAETPLYTLAEAMALDPALTSPEAAVVKFMASRVRGDTAWEGALVEERDGRLQRQLDDWADFDLEAFRLLARRDDPDGRIEIRVFMQIVYKGRSDQGEDEFWVMRQGDTWRVTDVPI